LGRPAAPRVRGLPMWAFPSPGCGRCPRRRAQAHGQILKRAVPQRQAARAWQRRTVRPVLSACPGCDVDCLEGRIPEAHANEQAGLAEGRRLGKVAQVGPGCGRDVSPAAPTDIPLWLVGWACQGAKRSPGCIRWPSPPCRAHGMIRASPSRHAWQTGPAEGRSGGQLAGLALAACRSLRNRVAKGRAAAVSVDGPWAESCRNEIMDGGACHDV